jgi:hypothetical protein
MYCTTDTESIHEYRPVLRKPNKLRVRSSTHLSFSLSLERGYLLTTLSLSSSRERLQYYSTRTKFVHQGLPLRWCGASNQFIIIDYACRIPVLLKVHNYFPRPSLSQKIIQLVSGKPFEESDGTQVATQDPGLEQP